MSLAEDSFSVYDIIHRGNSIFPTLSRDEYFKETLIPTKKLKEALKELMIIMVLREPTVEDLEKIFGGGLLK